MTDPQIDIIIVTKNGYQQLKKCVRHINNSKEKPNKIIIIDNNDSISNSFKQTIKKNCHTSRIKLEYIFAPNIGGISNARNEGLRHVTSSYYAFIDQDEYIHPQWITNIKLMIKNNPQINVLSGPKRSSLPKTYWKRIWDKLYENYAQYEGPTDFVTSSNTCYQTSFIRRHHLWYNPLFNQSSEDVVFCYLLKKKKANIFFSKKIWLEHDFRSNFKDFFVQWFKYGISLSLFDSIYFYQKNKLHYFNCMISKTKTMSNLKIKYIPGFIILNTALYLGYVYQTAK